MAKIKNTTAYPTVTPSANDLIIGTDVNDNNKTVTFTVSSLSGGSPVNQDLNSVLGVGNTSLLNIELNGTASALGSSISVIDVFPTTISAGGLGVHGTAGQVLSSTGTGLAWIAAPGTNQSWNDTLAVSPIAAANPELTGTFTIRTNGGLSLEGNSTLSVSGTSIFYSNVRLSDGVDLEVNELSKLGIDDGTGTYVYGTAGQFLSATGTGMAWSSATTLTKPTLQEVVDTGNTLLNSSIIFSGTGGIFLSGTNTISGNGIINLNGNATPTVSASRGRVIISQGSLDITGANTEIKLFGNAGTAGQALVSNGPFITPTWQTVAGASATLQQILNNGNTATQNINLTGDINLVGGGLKLGVNAFIELNGDRGTAGQVLVSGGSGGFPSWANAGTGIVTSIDIVDTTYLDMTIDSSIPAVPKLKTELITNGSIATGPGGLTTAFYSDNTTGTNYAVGNGLSTTGGTGSGMVVNITNTTAGNVVLADLTFTSGGSGYTAGDLVQVIQAGSNNDLKIKIDLLAAGTFYDQSGRFSVPRGKDWDIAVTNIGSTMVITNSDGTNSSSFTLAATGGAVFTNAGSNNIELSFSGSGTGTVQSVSLTDSTGTTGTAITSTGTFNFSEQAATATYLRTTSAVTGTAVTLSTETPTIQVVGTKGGTLLDTALTIQNSNGTTNNSFVLGTTASPSVATAGQVLAYNSTSGGFMEWVAQAGGGNMTSWDITGDTGGAGTVANAETVNIVGGTGVSTVSTPGTRTITINATGATLTLSGSADSIVGSNDIVTFTITAPGTGYVVDNYYPTTKLVSAIGTASGAVVRVFSVDGTGGVTGASLYGGGKDWTVGDTFTVDFGATLATLTVATIDSTKTVTTTWRGLSGTSTNNVGDYKINTIPRFETDLTAYSSKVFEFDGGGTGTFTGTALKLGSFSVTPINGQQIYVDGDIGYITTKDFPNIRLGNTTSAFNAGAQNNVGIGHNTLLSLTTGDSNTAIGLRALQDLNTGSNNIAIGDTALGGGVGGNRNIVNTIAIGNQAGTNAYGAHDTIVGSLAGQNMINTSAVPGTQEQMTRVAIGFQAMVGQDTSSATGIRFNKNDIAIGALAAAYQKTSNTTSSSGSVYIGLSAGQGVPNTTAMQSTLDSGEQVVVGSSAMEHGAGGRKGYIAIGHGASIGNQTTNIDTYNTSTLSIAIGYEAEGTTAITTNITRSGVGNIAIGYQSGGVSGATVSGGTVAIGSRSIAEGSDSIAIGTDATAGDNAKNDAIAIGKGASSKFVGGVAIGTGATATDANQLVFGSATNAVGTVIVATPAITTTTWTVKINGIDYKIPMYAA